MAQEWSGVLIRAPGHRRPHAVSLQTEHMVPPYHRYIEYMCDMVAEDPVVPHSKPILVRAVTMTPVPLFSKQRTGCRPFCEVYVGDERVTTTSQEYDRMR